MQESKIVNGMAVEAFDLKIVASRERILTATTEALDAELERYMLPSDKIALLEDFAKFCCFFGALKIAEVRTPLGRPIEKRDPLRAWWGIGKTIDKEVPVMLLEYGREAEARQMKGAGDEA